ncbi:MAG: M20 family metallopeptidase [Steroidobacteraceae bacterium]|jgi:acetylornithine deacetylase/succinyl-diaminopimelate desuccinylase-like protein|nr:M20 family metallopeptidase [Steroidobacteraceae bacterium]
MNTQIAGKTDPLDRAHAVQLIDAEWRSSIEPSLEAYIRIPNKSPLFDPDWQAHGHMDRAVELMADWCRRQPIRGLEVEVVRLPGRTPVLFATVPGTAPGEILLYGHFDKQPEFTGWDAGLDPWQPVVRDGRLYGRGGADDGYAVYSSLLAIRALQEQGLPHARCAILIEGCEESGSYDLPFYVEHLADRLGRPDLVVCLDAECGNYEQFWLTTSLRGNLVGTLNVEVLTEGVHSGMGTGIAPAPFRILRGLLERLENVHTGDVLLEDLHVRIPPERVAQAKATADVLGAAIQAKLPFAPGVRPVSNDPLELLLNSTWRPAVTITGAEGLPALRNAGNVLLPRLAVKLSLRLPPTLPAEAAAASVKRALEADPPYGARVSFEVASSLSGWNALPLAGWLEGAIARGSQEFFGRPAMTMGTGGSIPFIGMLQERYPETQFLVTGVLGPNSNAHGPNEFLDLATARRLTGCVSRVLLAHATR